MNIAITADPEIPVPPILYGGIERIIDLLVQGLTAKGHSVTLFAHRDSKVPCTLVPWKGTTSNGFLDQVRNTATLFRQITAGNFQLIHSFSRLAYMAPLMPLRIPKIMSYQREPTLGQIKKAVNLSRKGSLHFTGCSGYIADQIKPFAPSHTIYNCVPIDKYDFIQAVAPEAPLMFLGRIEPVKGTHIAVEVAIRSGRELIIAGNIPAEGTTYFDEHIKPFLNDRIRYVGPINDAQKNDLLGQCAGFLMPIQWNEPFGIVMAEAMACGTPVLGFPFGSVPEVVANGSTGFICSDVRDMVDKVAALHSINRKEVRAAAEQRFSGQAIVQQYLDLYNSVVD